MLEDIITSVHSLLTSHLPLRNNKTPGGWTTFDCVQCDDKRKRAGIIQEGPRISYNCFNCGFKTGWSPAPYMGKKYKELAKTLGADDHEIHKVQMELMVYAEALENISEDTTFGTAAAEFETIELPENAVSLYDLPSDHELAVYAKSRGLYGLYPFLHFPDVINKRRLVIPMTFDGELVGWAARHVDPPGNTPKYMLNTQPGYVFNIDKFLNDDREIVIVVEGMFDAIMVDGIGVLGNTVSPEQINTLQRLNKRIIVCPDRDEPGKVLIKQAMELDWEVSFPPWHTSCKDAADACTRYGRLATVNSIINYSTANKTKQEVMMRMQ